MDKVDAPDPSAFLLNPAVHSQVKAETRSTRDKKIRRGQKTRFSTMLKGVREGAELGPLQDLPVSEETVNRLMEDVHSAGDDLKNRPFPEEIIRYKRAVRDFMHYVVENGFSANRSEGVPRFLKSNYKGPHGTDESRRRQPYVMIQVVDKKLEDMAAEILSKQINQLQLIARLEEITGLLIDLLN
jgi:uncharacterized protein YaaR (DUF327 family)